jgi:hypothetical protein
LRFNGFFSVFGLQESTEKEEDMLTHLNYVKKFRFSIICHIPEILSFFLIFSRLFTLCAKIFLLDFFLHFTSFAPIHSSDENFFNLNFFSPNPLSLHFLTLDFHSLCARAIVDLTLVDF